MVIVSKDKFDEGPQFAVADAVKDTLDFWHPNLNQKQSIAVGSTLEITVRPVPDSEKPASWRDGTEHVGIETVLAP